MADRPESLARIDRILAAARIAHEAIWDLHHQLVATDRADERTRRLLREAARIATVDLSEVTSEVRRLDASWSEQELLDPVSAANTLRGLVAEVDRVEPRLADLRARQNGVGARTSSAYEFGRLIQCAAARAAPTCS